MVPSKRGSSTILANRAARSGKKLRRLSQKIEKLVKKIRRLPVVFLWAAQAIAADVTVRDATEFRRVVAEATPGTRILIAPGDYTGGFHFSNLRGETNRPIVIAAADPARPPVIKGGGTGLHFSDLVFVELDHLTLTGWSGNG